jgi:hypothetical protein
MSDEKYTVEELKLLNDKVCWCFYSWCQHEILKFSFKDKPVFIGKFLMDYYLERFFLEISELYTYFWNRKDEVVLGKFVTTKEERLKLKVVRNQIAHLDKKGLQDKLEKIKEFIKITNPDNQIFDLITIIKHTRVLLSRVGTEHHIVNRLKEILKLYPPGFIKESVLKEMLN